MVENYGEAAGEGSGSAVEEPSAVTPPHIAATFNWSTQSMFTVPLPEVLEAQRENTNKS